MRAITFGIGSLLVACNASSSAVDVGRAPTALRAATSPLDDLSPEVRDLAQQVERARGLPFRRKVVLSVLDRPAFKQRLREEVRPPPKDVASADFFFAFGFTKHEPPPRWLASLFSSRSTALAEEQTLGFYVSGKREFFVPGDADLSSTKGRTVLAHELAHALLDDHVPLAPLHGTDVDDEELAHSAMIEGDAVLTSWIVAAQRSSEDVREAVRKRVVSAEATSFAAFDGGAVGEAELTRALPINRERFLFPYAHGAAFMGRVYLSGGLAAVDGVWRHPPASTADIFRPERYVAGTPTAPLAEPAVSNGRPVLATGRMGELKARVFLAQKVPAGEAVIALEGWMGDRYVVLGGAERTTGWVVAFDTDAHAEGFAAALARHGEVSRSGRLVGFSSAPAALTPRALLAVDVPSLRSAPPLGQLVLVDAWESGHPDDDAPDTGDATTCEFARADVRVSVPDGWKLGRGSRLTCQISDGLGAVAVGEVIDLPADEARLAVQRTLAAGILKRLGSASAVTERPRATAFGVVRSSVLSFPNMTAESVAIPLCGGRRSLAISAVYATEQQRWAFDRYVATLAPRSVGRGRGCLAP